MTQRATFFEFTSYEFEPHTKRLLFHYTTHFTNREALHFTETITLPGILKLGSLPKELLDKLLQSLHMVLGISYFKFYYATEFKLPYVLSKKEADFWNVGYKKGLGEFLYKNNVDPSTFPEFPYSDLAKKSSWRLPLTTKSLVGIGGGKDSIVALELLKEHQFDATLFNVQTTFSPIIESIVKVSGLPNLNIERKLDPKVFEKHDYDGHVPISAMYAFLGLATAVLNGYSYVIVGNEHSSNFGNITYKGLRVNHQWSKSFEFEKLLHSYVKDFISPDVQYFSLLRGLHEIQIAKLFAKHRKYFSYFSSCNRNFVAQENMEGLWCGECAKCVFVFTILSAWLSKKELLDIFKKNLYEDESLLPLFKDILGLGTMKPFDCVGTFEEVQTAVYLAKEKFGGTFIMRQLGGKVKYHQNIFRVSKETLIPKAFALLAAEHILVAGLGKEGEVSKKYLKKYYPKITVGVADSKEGSRYLRKQKDFDVAIKTPGLHKDLIAIPYTTATNIFFSHLKGKHTIIGITGSKGKSTTSSLIYAMLKQAKKPVVLVGNIGKPMLEVLLRPIPKETIFVVELSSYQLDDICFSPDIAVLTSFFPEHVDFHKTLKKYYEAKRNIIAFQSAEHYFVYNPNIQGIGQWLKEYRGKAIPASLQEYQSKLLGEHNNQNIGAAVSVVKILGVSDEIIQQTLEKFKSLEHRLEYVGTFKGITFYNDAISTTPESTIAAIEALKNVDTIFLGGTDRGQSFVALEKTLKKYNIKNVVLFPDSGKRILKNKKAFTVLQTRTMKEAVRFAYKHTKKGGICLLSCASASYSIWKNFEHKGNEFKKEVRKYSKQ